MMKNFNLIKTAFVLAALMVGLPEASSGYSAENLGTWSSDFADSKAYADANHIPMLCFWGKTGCGYCSSIETIFGTTGFATWQANRKLVMWKEVDAKEAGYNFTKNPSSGHLPYLCLYWNKPDGSVINIHWAGRNGEMPDTTGSSAYSKTLIKSTRIVLLRTQLINSIEKYITDYIGPQSYAGGTFAPVGQLEAEAGLTAYVDIPLVRTATAPATNTLAAGAWTTNFTWAAGETNKTVRYPVSEDLAAPATITLYLSDAQAEDKGAQGGTNTINIVAPVANSAVNPLWLGERTADTLKAGEWTMDLDAATNRTAKQTGDAYTLVVAAGSLWCPDCKMIDTNLFAKAEFKAWAASNNVSLVLLDTPPTGYDAPTLLSDATLDGISGSAYLSRKMIPAADTANVLARNHELLFNTYKLPGWKGARVWVPTEFLFRKDGTIAGRIGDDKFGYAPIAVTMTRLDELLKLADDATEEKNGDVSTTMLGIGPKETVDTQTLCAVDTVDVWALTNMVPGIHLQAVVSGSEAADVTNSLIQIADGKTNVLATAYGNILSNVTIEADIIGSGSCYVIVSGKVTTTFALTDSAVSTVRKYALRTVPVLLPQEGTTDYKVPSEGANVSVAVKVVSNEVYKLTGFTSIPASLVEVDSTNGLYRAIASGAVDLSAAGGSVVQYAHWVPGTIAFTTASQRVIENSGSCVITVSRAGGTSGSNTVSVSLDTNATTAAVTRYTWADTNLVWGDGETGSKSLTLKLNGNQVFEGEQIVKLNLTAVDCTAALVSPTNQTISISDTDDPVFGQERYDFTLYANIGYSKDLQIYNIKESGRVTLKKTSGKLPSGMTLEYDEDSGMVLLSGTPKRIGDYTFAYTVTERRSSGKVTGTEATFTLHVLDVGTMNPFYGQSRSFIGSPLYATNGMGAVLAGTLNVTIGRTGRTTARYYGTARSSISFSSKQWTGFDETTGMLMIDFPTRNGVTLSLAMDANGKVSVAMDDPTSIFSADFSSSISAELPEALAPATDYAGYYTVTLPYTNSVVGTPSELVAPNGTCVVAASGTGFLTLNMTSSSAIRRGLVKYAGVLPNGTSVSGSAVLLEGTVSGTAALPIFKRQARDVLGAVLSIRENGATAYVTDPEIILSTSALPYWAHEQDGFTFRRGCEVYGGYFDTGKLLQGCCEDAYTTTTMTFDVGAGFIASDSQDRGAINSLPETTLTVSGSKLRLDSNPNNLRISYSKSTGIFKGTFKIVFSDGRTSIANYRGVLLPGWSDCCNDKIIRRPFGSGSCWFTDKYDEVSVKRGMSIDLNPLK